MAHEQEAGEAAAAWLESRLPEMDEVLRELVEINSFTHNPEGGRKVAAKLDAFFATAGLSSETFPSQQFADHRVYRSAGNGSAAVGLVGHLDTVFPPGKFEGFRVDGALRRGPGVLDMKGGLVVMGFALRALKETGVLQKIAPVTCVIVSDEEIGSPEGKVVIRKVLPGARAALVFEAGREQDLIVTRRKGSGAMTAKAFGKAAHAGNAHAAGANAIWTLARFIDAAQGLTNYSTGVTVNVGKISGGQGKNTVPDAADAALDLRFCTRSEGQKLVEDLHACANAAAKSVPGTSMSFEGGIARDPMEASPESQALREAYGRCARKSGLGDGEAPLSGGSSDGNTTSPMGIPTIDGMGPRGKGFHTVDEFIEAQSLILKAQALARFLASNT